MRIERMVDRLDEAGVLKTDRNGDVLGLGTAFRETEAANESNLRNADEADRRRLLTERAEAHAPLLDDVAAVDPAFVGTYLALDDHVPELSHDQRVRLVVALDSLRSSGPPTEGTPDGFLPIHGRHVPAIAALYPAAIVFVWREDCPPCERVRADLEDLDHVAPERVARFAVFGPDSAEILRSEYDVVGGPTTLFFEDGSVAARLLGAAHPDALERELRLVGDAV